MMAPGYFRGHRTLARFILMVIRCYLHGLSSTTHTLEYSEFMISSIVFTMPCNPTLHPQLYYVVFIGKPRELAAYISSTALPRSFGTIPGDL
jgi:hypothetical protein